MAKIYSGIDGIKCPKIEDYPRDYDAYDKACTDYLEKVKKNLSETGRGPCRGKMIRSPRGDGYAIYVVASLNPLELVHIATGDAWDDPNAEYWTAAQVKAMIQREEGMRKLFGS